MTKRIRAVSGGTFASKTISILIWLIDFCQSNKNQVCTVVAESVPHLRLGAIRDFKNIMTYNGYWKDNNWNESQTTYTFETQSILEFKSFDKFGKSHGPRRDVLFLNEAISIPYNIADQLITRTKKVVWLDWNPFEEFWFYTEFLNKRNDVEMIKLNYLDVVDPITKKSLLNPQIIQEIESHKNNLNWWKVYGLGELGEIESRIYSGWRIIDEIPFEARLMRRWLDFGYVNDYSAIGDVYYYNGGWILDEQLYQKGLSNKQLADFLLALPQNNVLVVADSAEPKSIDEIRSYGVNIIPSQKGKDSVIYGIQIVQSQPISVTNRSYNILKEYRNYLFLVDKNGKILSEEDPRCENHHMSGIRYALVSLGRLKPEMSYFDKIFFEDKNNKKNINKAL